MGPGCKFLAASSFRLPQDRRVHLACQQASADASLLHACLCRERLQPAKAGWPADGQSDDEGSSIGGEVTLKAESLASFSELFAKRAFFGDKRAVASFRGAVAIGMSSGVLFVLMPRGLNAQGALTG